MISVQFRKFSPPCSAVTPPAVGKEGQLVGLGSPSLNKCWVLERPRQGHRQDTIEEIANHRKMAEASRGDPININEHIHQETTQAREHCNKRRDSHYIVVSILTLQNGSLLGAQDILVPQGLANQL